MIAIASLFARSARRRGADRQTDKSFGGNKPRRRALVIEDNPEVQLLLRHVMEEQGFDVRGAANSRDARELIERERFDVVLCDVLLPGNEDGITLGERAASVGAAVALITGSQIHVDKLDETGFPYLLKPFRIAEVTELVRGLVAGRERVPDPVLSSGD